MVKARFFFNLLVLFLLSCPAWGKDTINIKLGYLAYETESEPVLSNILPEPDDSGLKGAQLGINDSNTTGKFLGHSYALHMYSSPDIQQLIDKALEWNRDDNVEIFVTNMTEDALTQFVPAVVKTGALIFNAGSRSNRLRSEACLPNTLHTRPSDAMLTDALGQWFVYRKQKKWFLISGSQPRDLDFSNSLKRTARRYGIEIVAEKSWTFDTDLRRNAQKEMPLFTKADDYDAVIIADVAGDFGEYVLHNSWLPRPVAGTQGLTPVTWHRVVEQWGAAQLQSRFDKLSGRWMTSTDYAAWAAVRSVAEAVTKTKRSDASSISNFLTSESFQLAGFKGRKLSFRDNGQLRQPIPLIHPRALVGQAPIEGFLHAGSDLDSLGLDAAESTCKYQLQ